MKKSYLLSVATALVALTMTACSGSVTTETEEVAAPVTYSLDAEASSLKWKGDAADGSHSHEGTVKISEGTATYEGDDFKSGSFKVDLNKIDSELDAATGEGDLIKHLATADFLNSLQFPTVDVTINSVTDTEVKATLKVAGKNFETTFPAKTSKSDKKLTIKGKFDIDFTSLGIKGFTPDPAMEAKHKGSYVSPIVHFDLDAVLKAEATK